MKTGSRITQVASVQAGSVLFDKAKTIEKFSDLLSQASEGFDGDHPRLTVFPEAFIGGYPKGHHFGAPVGSRSDEGREWFARYFQDAIEVPGRETSRFAELAKDFGADIILGVIERDGGTLYCTALCFSSAGELVGKHRKLMPTAAERLIWGYGDGSTLEAYKTKSGILSSVICWENYMPALRLSQYAQGVEIYCAPTVDDRPNWTSTMTTIALEGRCFVASASQFLKRSDAPKDFLPVQGDHPDTVLINGGSVIISPLGKVLAGPLFGEEGIISAALDFEKIAKGKMDFDATGHYARSDVFSLKVNTKPEKPVDFE